MRFRQAACLSEPKANVRDGGRHSMTGSEFGRRDFLNAVVGSAAAAAVSSTVATTVAVAAPENTPQPASAPPNPGYEFLNPEEAAFVEALVDHMIPADELSPKGTDIGVNIYIDRALAGAWGNGDRLYMQGPWKAGVPSQGYQLPLTPAQLYRAGIEATNAYCRKTHGATFDRLTEQQCEEVLFDLSKNKIKFDSGLPARPFWTVLYQTVMEGMFSDPIYGGNRDKAGWKMIGFPGAIAVYREQIEKYRDKPFPGKFFGISDMS